MRLLLDAASVSQRRHGESFYRVDEDAIVIERSKKKTLKAAGWRVGTPAEFLGLSPEEAAFVELKLALADYLRQLRAQHGWTQIEAAKLLNSSQSRVAKMEAADPTVSVDLLVRALLALGASRKELGRVIAARAA